MLEAAGFIGIVNSGRTTLRALIEKLKATYCGNFSAQFMHIRDRERCNWLRARIEVRGCVRGRRAAAQSAGRRPQIPPPPLSKAEQRNLLDRMLWADQFETFAQVKYSAVKRFGLDGLESLVPGMKVMVDTGAVSRVWVSACARARAAWSRACIAQRQRSVAPISCSACRTVVA